MPLTAIRPGFITAAAPLTKRLFASEPPLVKITSVGWALTAAPTRPRASSIAARACRPYSCRLEALPKRLASPAAPSQGSIASRTASSSGAVAFQSR